MKSLDTITSLKLARIPRFTPDYFQEQILSNLYLEFFFKESRFLVSPRLEVLATGPHGEAEATSAEELVKKRSTQIQALKEYLIYQLSLYSSLLESNSYYITLNKNTIISRFVPVPDHPDDFEVKLYTIDQRELPGNYKDKIFIGRDFISLTRIDREHFGLKHIRNSLKDQLQKLKVRFAKHVPENDQAELTTEYVNEIAELISDFSSEADQILESAPVAISTSSMSTDELTVINRQFRELKHILIELEDTSREMERYMFDNVMSRAARYATKFRKDLTNHINYIMLKVNGRISDAVNGTHI